MTPLLTIIVVVFLVGLVIPKRTSSSPRRYGFSVKLPYFVFVVALASSPAAGALIGSFVTPGKEGTGFLQFLWVSVAISLPLSLLTARMFGRTNLPEYWEYLESFGGHSRALITGAWGLVTTVAVVGSLAVTFIK